MVKRKYWLERIKSLHQVRSIVWLSGVRRVGKTCLSRQIEGAVYLNCDLPSVRRRLEDPEFFFQQHASSEAVLILDEVHRVADPSMILKIAADEFPGIKILATGSSTLQASKKFRDTLTDRKRSLHLPPVLWRECRGSFAAPDLDSRLSRGGLPGRLLDSDLDPDFWEDWIDSFYARDILELFAVRNRTGFLALLHLVCRRSGGQLDVTDLANQSSLSRPTVMSHLDALEISHALRRLPPYHGGDQREIVRQPRIYVFDTGLVVHARGWTRIRDEDRGHLWEHLVLDELAAAFPVRSLRYWRDKNQHEIDFVVEREEKVVDAMEAKINSDHFDVKSLTAFRRLHPRGDNYVLSPHVTTPYQIRRGPFKIHVRRPDQLI